MVEYFSNSVFGLQGNLYQEFIEKIATPIIKSIIKTDDFEIVGSENHLSSLDFKNAKNPIASHIYKNFLSDIFKDKQSNKVYFKKKVCITLDKRLCNEVCPNTGRKITTIKIGGVELVYFIYFDIGEFFDFVYNNSDKTETMVQNSSNKNSNLISNNLDKKQILAETDNSVKANDLKDLDKLLKPTNLHQQQNQKYENIHFTNNQNHKVMTKIGYIHNNNEGFSYLRTSIDREGIFRISHRRFPEIQNFSIGTVIKAECEVDENERVQKVRSYYQCSNDELDISFKEFVGNLERDFGKNFAFVTSDNAKIYIPPSLARSFDEGKVYYVQCLAVESRDKNGNRGWEALEVTSSSGGNFTQPTPSLP